jgi:DNA-binding NarL/FixJ family response regulator
MIKILIADDHPIVRQGLKQIISEEPAMQVLGEAQNSQEVLELVRKKNWDVVVLDITMPGRSGLDVLKELKTHRPRLPILILSVHPEDQYALRVLKAGASGYLTKESAPDVLVTAIRKVVAGRRYISATLAEKLAGELVGEPGPVHERLSDREFQIMCMIARGKSLKEIAGELFLSPKTVSTYRGRLLEKMAMASNAELTRYLIEHHLS